MCICCNYMCLYIYIYIHMIHLFNIAHWSSMKIGYPTINLMGNMMINLIQHGILAVYSCFGQD